MGKNRETLFLICTVAVTFFWVQIGMTAKQISNNQKLDYEPSLFEGAVAWYAITSGGSSNADIFYYDNNTTIQITNDNLSKSRPKLYDGIITWAADNDIFYWENGTTYQLTGIDDNNHDRYPCVYEGTIAWISNGINMENPLEETGYDIYLWDRVTNTKTQVTNTKTYKTDLSYHNGGMVWVENDGTDDEIFYLKGSTIIQLTDNDFDDHNPQIWDGVIVWWGGDLPYQYEIYYYDGAAHQLTDDGEIDKNPSIYEGNIAWERTEVETGEGGIFYYDKKSQRQISDLGTGNPSLYGDQIAFMGLDEEDTTYDSEIYIYDIDASIGRSGGGSGGGGCFIGSLF